MYYSDGTEWTGLYCAFSCLMDEIIYAYEAGTLDGLLLNLRPVEFAEARDAWLADNPNADREFRTWYRDTFDREPPGPPTDAAPVSRR